jgi:fermentation-respiration switch protein FrsA (DUF1100 family)
LSGAKIHTAASPVVLRDAIMPIETTTELAHPLAAGRQARADDGHERGSAMRAGLEKMRGALARALTIAGALVSRMRRRPRTMTVLGSIAAIAFCLYIALTAVVYFSQRSLMYFPDIAHTTPAAAGLPEAEEVALTTADGVQIHAWHVTPQDNKPVVLYFHGNGGSLKYRVGRFSKLIGAGIGLVAVEYRGYGGDAGAPSEQGLIADAEAGYAFAAAHYPAQQIVVWGESLGSGVAVALAAEKPVGRVILEAPFTSAVAVGARHYWYLPVRLLMKDQFRSDRRIAKVTAPLLILHGVQDRTVPYAMGEQLFALANQPKHLVRFLDGGHEDLDQNGALDAVARFLAGDLD